MRIDLEPRGAPSRALEILAPIAAFVVAMLIGGLVVWLLGKSPARAFQVVLEVDLHDPT